MNARFIRLSETARPAITIRIDGRPVTALQGDTVLVAMLTVSSHVRVSEFGDGLRAGFCLMGACQDCWVWLADGTRVRACTTPVAENMDLRTQAPGTVWSTSA